MVTTLKMAPKDYIAALDDDGDNWRVYGGTLHPIQNMLPLKTLPKAGRR